MTKEKFLDKINVVRSPKYKLEDIHSDNPKKDCAAIVCTENDNIYLARFVDNRWEQAIVHNTGKLYPSQEFLYKPINSKVLFWVS